MVFLSLSQISKTDNDDKCILTYLNQIKKKTTTI
jgi:hypothetical protein